MKNILFIIFTLLLITACAQDSNNSNGEQLATVPPANHCNQYPCYYEYPGVNCTTGSHYIANRQQHCMGLRNDVRNNHCAIQDRYSAFREYCRHYRWQR